MKSSILANPLKLSETVTIKNRFHKSAMSETLGTKTNNPKPILVSLYDAWAKGGAGLLVTGNVMIDRKALGEPGNVVIEDERDLDMLKKWAKAGTQNGTHLWMQLNHPGKQSPKSVSKTPVAPSAIPLSGHVSNMFNKPRALTTEEIKDLIKRFGNAARIAKKAGFTGVQIHGAHGYLVSQFLSPHHNQRTDEWGGNLNNRMRFLLETYKEIRRQVGEDFPIGLKLNSADFQRGGFTEEDSMQVLKKMSEVGIDMIEISGGNYESPVMMENAKNKWDKMREAYFLEYAEKAREIISVPLVVTGGFRSEKGMTNALKSGAVDMIGIGKPFVLIPDLPNRIFAGTYETINIKPIRTGVNWLDARVGSMLDLGWYEQQLIRIGKGRNPKPNYSPWLSLFQNMANHGLEVFKKRRA
ncbi:NADH:flavin oxidoreductase/NADH oxidase family protein [Bacillus sp. 1P06AnD]|uniref:NADH:flavin oxidoreductase/NADH oxidase family protein n=1 Tax=Bacillus sp. 1P06AnD TaxID=3132208 RepID=UPI0039A057E6